MEIDPAAIVAVAALLAQAAGNGVIEDVGARGAGALVKRLLARFRAHHDVPVEDLTEPQLQDALAALADADAPSRALIAEIAREADPPRNASVTNVGHISAGIFVSGGTIGRIG